MPDELPGAPPPTYAQEYPQDAATEPPLPDPQILIIPATNSLRFQQGCLGADGERAAIEGELQIKGADGGRWHKVLMELRTAETAFDRTIELGHAELVLYEADPNSDAPLPASFPFAIPLTPDTPQCIHTPHSSLAHTITATLLPIDPTCAPLSKTLIVHTRRFLSHADTLGISPVTRTLESPARIQVEVPRTTFTSHEPVPIYVTVPSPPPELVVERGLRLRNVKAELVRSVRVKRDESEDGGCVADFDIPTDSEDESDDENVLAGDAPLGVSLPSHEKHREASSSAAHLDSTVHHGPGALYRTIVSRSGALCRFHTSLPLRLRFVLHQSSPTSSPLNASRPLLPTEFGLLDSDTECASITQHTLLHSVTFRIRVHATFRNMTNHTERVSTISIPITFLPPPAPLPEVEEWMDTAYHKKHDRPPTRTVRGDDQEAAPHYEEGQAGPSYLASGAPPPFEERDAPPPFFAEASSSARLPTFLESEQEIFVPSAEDSGMEPCIPPVPRDAIEGEGVLFGFPASAQFDGHAEEIDRAGSATPPPTLEMATRDPNVTELARLDLEGPEGAIQALGLALEQVHEEAAAGHPLPPPPPPMDDPSDPPPSIHSEYRSREGVAHQTPRRHSQSPPAHPPPPVHSPGETHPPPYLVPDGEQEHVARPPPYVDVMPPAREH